MAGKEGTITLTSDEVLVLMEAMTVLEKVTRTEDLPINVVKVCVTACMKLDTLAAQLNAATAPEPDLTITDFSGSKRAINN